MFKARICLLCLFFDWLWFEENLHELFYKFFRNFYNKLNNFDGNIVLHVTPSMCKQNLKKTCLNTK